MRTHHRNPIARAWAAGLLGALLATSALAADDWESRFEDRFQGVLAPDTEYRAVVTLEKGGSFTILFRPDLAPNHVASFVSLARKGYFDGTTFHRVLDGFMAQGGDPTGTGSGGPGYTVRAEFSKEKHVRGTVSAARKGNDIHSAGSQFFLCFAPAPFLDGQYTIYGRVESGMEVVDGIRRRNPVHRPGFPGDAIATVEIVEKPVGEAADEAADEAAGEAPAPAGDAAPAADAT